jgi:hypothetical protein
MLRRDWIIISALVVLWGAAETAIAVLTVAGPSEYAEYIEFGIVMVFFIALLVASYLYVIMPPGRSQREERDNDQQ